MNGTVLHAVSYWDYKKVVTGKVAADANSKGRDGQIVQTLLFIMDCKEWA